MTDWVVKWCVVAFNFMFVVLWSNAHTIKDSVGNGLIKLFCVLGYLITIVLLAQGDNNENNRREDDDV